MELTGRREYIDYRIIDLQMVCAIYRQNHRYQSICAFMTIKNNIQYITYDVDGHNGGVWKAGNKKWAESGGRSASRSGTYDENLKKIGD